MRIKKTLLAAALGAGLLSAASAHAALTLSVDGNTVYDTDLNLTWLANANLAASNTFGVSGITAFGLSAGRMNWYTAQNWIGAMNAANYLGFNDWRLPTVTDTGTPGCNFGYNGTDCGYNVNTATGEMAHLWYDELGNIPYYNTAGAGGQSGWGLTNTGPFSNVPSGLYWSGTEYAPNTSHAWYFLTNNGNQYALNKSNGMFAWAVRPGQVAAVSAVPEPEAVAMLLAGLGLLGFTARRRRLGLR
ncbi:MAG: hypothetical protein FD134_2041 [Gallionellaceae bacterium]|nr:MAG: hypothetical protein FD134_2041 [Gallionellaceae bacterium]